MAGITGTGSPKQPIGAHRRADAGKPPLPGDKRAASRTSTTRSTRFEAFREKSLPREGVVADISRDGVQIRTKTPEAVGALLHIQIEPRSDDDTSDPIVVRGNVVRVRSLANGEYAMGVKMEMPNIRSSLFRMGRSRTKAASILASTQKQSPDKATYSPRGARAAWAADLIEKVEGAKRRKHRRPRVRLLLLILLLLTEGAVVFVFGQSFLRPFVRGYLDAHQNKQPVGSIQAESGVPRKRTTITKPTPEPAQPARESRSADSVETETGNVEWAETGSPDSIIAPLEVIDTTSIEIAEGTPISESSPTEIDETAVAAAPAPEMRIESPAGVVELRRLHPAADTNTSSRATTDAQGAEASVAPMTDASAVDGASDVRIEVDTRRFTMTILSGNEAVRRFPVGLGKSDSTPSGAYYISNKIKNPSWYHQGKTVKADDPANPLGEYWLGLANDDGPTGYGIHPTDDSSSIGKEASAGCIRMRPQDSAALFRLCPVGTPVSIRR